MVCAKKQPVSINFIKKSSLISARVMSECFVPVCYHITPRQKDYHVFALSLTCQRSADFYGPDLGCRKLKDGPCSGFGPAFAGCIPGKPLYYQVGFNFFDAGSCLNEHIP